MEQAPFKEFKVRLTHVTKLGIFFKYSPKRQLMLEKVLKEAQPPVNITKVGICIGFVKVATLDCCFYDQIVYVQRTFTQYDSKQNGFYN